MGEELNIYIFNAAQLCALLQRPLTQDAKKPHWSESMTNHMKPHISVISCNILHPAIQEAAQLMLQKVRLDAIYHNPNSAV